jgi:GntR family transcriptional regulator/MocR family aminotransferase
MARNDARYQRLYRELRDAISSGRLAGGARLPGSRTMARELGVARIVVLMAYEQLAAEGYVSSRVGSGTRVAVQPARASPAADGMGTDPGPIEPVSSYARRARAVFGELEPAEKQQPDEGVDFRFTHPVPDPRTLLLWRQALTRAAASPQIGYPVPAGHERLRKAVADLLRERRGLRVDPGDILIVNGSQQAVDLALRVLSEPGSRLGLEDPHYPGTRKAMLAAGARLVACEVDEQGLDVAKHAHRLRGARAVWVTPSRQFPTGAVMTVERRRALLEWSVRTGAWIVEDDYESDFQHGAGQIPAIQALDTRGRVLYLGSFARTLFPALRLAYMVIPKALWNTFHAVKWLADRGSPPLEQRALVDFIRSGAYESARRRVARRLLDKAGLVRAELRKRFDESELAMWGAPTGLHHFLHLRRIPGAAEQEVVELALRRGVRVSAGSGYRVGEHPCATVIVGVGRVAERDISRGVQRLAEAVRSLDSTRRPEGQAQSLSTSSRRR